MQNIDTPIIRTDRLILRPWREEDLELFAKINANPRVMEYFPSILSKEESASLAEKIQKELMEKKYGLWAVEASGVAPFIGFIGLNYQDFHAAFTPCVEVGWRLDPFILGKGICD
jgi:3-dehydroquinate dehydratase / shikimate dehydrogenase